MWDMSDLIHLHLLTADRNGPVARHQSVLRGPAFAVRGRTNRRPLRSWMRHVPSVSPVATPAIPAPRTASASPVLSGGR